MLSITPDQNCPTCRGGMDGFDALYGISDVQAETPEDVDARNGLIESDEDSDDESWLEQAEEQDLSTMDRNRIRVCDCFVALRVNFDRNFPFVPETFYGILFEENMHFYKQAVCGQLIDRNALGSLLREGLIHPIHVQGWGMGNHLSYLGVLTAGTQSRSFDSSPLYKDIVDQYGMDILTDEDWIEVFRRDQPHERCIPDAFFTNLALGKRLCRDHPKWLRRISLEDAQEIALEVVAADPRQWSSLPKAVREIESVCVAAGRKPCTCAADSKFHNKSCTRKKKGARRTAAPPQPVSYS